jgi:hypothetical protein
MIRLTVNVPDRRLPSFAQAVEGSGVSTFCYSFLAAAVYVAVTSGLVIAPLLARVAPPTRPVIRTIVQLVAPPAVHKVPSVLMAKDASRARTTAPKPVTKVAVRDPAPSKSRPGSAKPEHEGTLPAETDAKRAQGDFVANIPYFIGVSESHNRQPDLRIVANSTGYMDALKLLGVVIALTPDDIDKRHRAILWRPGSKNVTGEQAISPDSVTRELAVPLDVQDLRDPVADAALWYGVNPKEIRAFTVYPPETWKALCGRALITPGRQGSARLKYLVRDGKVSVEVE